MMQIFERFNALDALTLEGFFLGEYDFSILGKGITKSLKSLKLSFCGFNEKIMVDALVLYLEKSQLVDLSLTDGDIYYESTLDLTPMINVLPKVSTLKSLSLDGYTGLNTASLFSILPKTSIETLILKNVQIKDADIAVFLNSNLTPESLKKLSIPVNDFVSAEMRELLSRLAKANNFQLHYIAMNGKP